MAEGPTTPDPGPVAPAETHGAAAATLGSATYEIIRQRLAAQGEQLRERMQQLDTRRQ
jgi:hypothetical protein